MSNTSKKALRRQIESLTRDLDVAREGETYWREKWKASEQSRFDLQEEILERSGPGFVPHLDAQMTFPGVGEEYTTFLGERATVRERAVALPLMSGIDFDRIAQHIVDGTDPSYEEYFRPWEEGLIRTMSHRLRGGNGGDHDNPRGAIAGLLVGAVDWNGAVFSAHCLPDDHGSGLNREMTEMMLANIAQHIAWEVGEKAAADRSD